MNMDFERKLAIPMEVKKMYPVNDTIKKVYVERDAMIKNILNSSDNRLLLIIGPCSADNEDSVMDYLLRLKKLQEDVKDKIIIVPRLYTNKPRTTGEGYKGMLHQPDPTGKPDMFKGIIATRKLHMRAVLESELTCADEMLYPENHKYLDDLLGYVAVGARSVEDQQHRLTASGIEVPVGMKNPTSGDFSVMMNAINMAQHGHTFIYRGWEAHSHGNEYAHAILRGYTNMHGQPRPNYHYEDVVRLCDSYDEFGSKNPAIIIDANHANSGKNPFEQFRIVDEVLSYCRHNERVGKIVKGFMIESYIEDGCQPVDGGVYGKSITDACLGWEKTERLVKDMAMKL